MASLEMEPICSTDSPLPQPVDALKASLAMAAAKFAEEATNIAGSDPVNATLLLDSASRAYSAIS
jgi:hypothetical protein